MKKFLFVLFAAMLLINVTAFSQSMKELANYSFSVFLGDGTDNTPMDARSTEVYKGNNRVAIYTAGTGNITKETINTDTSIIDATTLNPIFRSSFSSAKECVLHYDKMKLPVTILISKRGKGLP